LAELAETADELRDELMHLIGGRVWLIIRTTAACRVSVRRVWLRRRSTGWRR
jgi:hypothetical protein